MTKQEKEQYKDKAPIGVYCCSYGAEVYLMDIIYGIEDYAVVKIVYSNKTEYYKPKIRYGLKSSSFRIYGVTYDMGKFMRC